MVKFFTVDIFIIGAASVTIITFARSFKKKRNKEVTVLARFVGGPMDGKSKWILPNATYVYRNKELPAPVLYKHTGYNIYEYVSDVMEGGK